MLLMYIILKKVRIFYIIRIKYLKIDKKNLTIEHMFDTMEL